MELKTYEGVEIDTCSNCGGTWLDFDELRKIVETEEEKFTPSQIKVAIEEISKDKKIREELMRDILSSKKNVKIEELNPEEILSTFKERWGGRRQIRCPKCQTLLEEFEYAGTGVMLDRCPKQHGFWLDKGELEKVQIMMEYYKRMYASAQPPSDMTVTQKMCPYCKEKLMEKIYEGVPIDTCQKCGGVWLDKDELYQIVERREKSFTPEEKAEVKPEPVQQPKQTELVEEINCPICGVVMKRLTYASTSGIIIDRCPRGDGIWLDKGELEKIQIYIEKSEELGEKEYAKYTRIFNEVKLDWEKRREEMLQRIKVSRFEAVNRMMRWLARKWD